MTPKRYRLARETSGYGGILIAVAMAGVGVWMLATGKGGSAPDWYLIPFWTAWFWILGYSVYQQGTAAREIVVHDNDQVEFVSLWQRTSIRASDIRSIRAVSGRYPRVVVKHTDGKIRLAGAFDQFHQFVTELESASSGIELSGI